MGTAADAAVWPAAMVVLTAGAAVMAAAEAADAVEVVAAEVDVIIPK